jgi:hypothetical protein
MKQYLELADQLDKMADEQYLDVEKVASLYLLHAYKTCNDSILESPAIVKTATEMLDEEDLAAYIGVNLVVQAITDGEV